MFTDWTPEETAESEANHHNGTQEVAEAYTRADKVQSGKKQVDKTLINAFN